MDKCIFVVMEAVDGSVKNVGFEMLTPAKEIAAAKGLKTVAVLVGNDVAEAAKLAGNYGADAALTVDDRAYETYSAEAQASVLAQLAEKYNPEIILIGATPNGKDLAPRLAVKLNAGCASDVTAMKLNDEGKVAFTCPVYGGTILAENVVETVPQMATVRGGAFKKAEASEKEIEIICEDEIAAKADDLKTKITDVVKEISESVNLEDAEVIVAGGRGMGSEENFALVKELADLLGGVVGATRAPIESGWISRAHQIGQSGKIVAPKLYIACGISGATQHVTGMIGSDYIVAINKDEDAPIFDVANVGIVGNVLQVIPEMIAEIKKMRA